MKYIIHDWSEGARLKPELEVPIEFDTFDEAWAYIHENIDEAIWEDLFIVEKI